MSAIDKDNYDGSDDPVVHYNRVTRAWGYLLEENLHYGLFNTSSESLDDATDNLTQLMLEHAGLAKGHRVLDVGCGTGQPACTMASTYGCSVVGISPSQVCIDSANARAIENSLSEQVHFQIGDGMAMDFPSNSFDCVWVMESSHLMADKSALLREASRVLKPGGTMVLCDVVLQRRLPLQQVIKYRDDFILLRDAFGRALMQTMDYYIEQSQLNEMQVTFKRDITLETRPTFAFWRENANKHKAAVVSEMGEKSWAQFMDSCTVLESFWDSGILGYGIIAAVKVQ